MADKLEYDKKDFYTTLKNEVKKYIRFGTDGSQTLMQMKVKFYGIKLPDDISSTQVPAYEAKISKLHAFVSFELSCAEASLRLAEEMYNYAFLREIDTIADSFRDKKQRLPGKDTIEALAKKSLGQEFVLQKLYAEQAVIFVKKAMQHLDFLSSRLKNIVESSKVNARLEKGTF